MNILALDACLDACSAAAGRGVRSLTPSLAFASQPMAVGHAEQLMPMIEMVMREAGLPFGALDRIAVTVGPGTFTGARISIAAARAFSLATGAPIVAYSSFELMAMSPSIPAARGRRLAVATDARRGEVYLQIFERHSLLAESPPQLVALSDAARVLGRAPVTVAGSGAKAICNAVTAECCDAEAILPGLLPEAIDMLFVAGEARTSRNVMPLYLRPPDAKPPSALPLTSIAS